MYIRMYSMYSVYMCIFAGYVHMYICNLLQSDKVVIFEDQRLSKFLSLHVHTYIHMCIQYIHMYILKRVLALTYI